MKLYTSYMSAPCSLIKVETNEMSVVSVSFVKAKGMQSGYTPPILSETIKQLTEYFSGKRRSFSVSCNIEGTAFQKTAWEALMKIPYGQTISYSEQAILMNKEKSVRAVGNANSQNKIAIIIPCHRVIHKDKTLSGYGGGTENKKWLIEFEKRSIAL